MADKTLNIKKLQLRNDTAANWTTKNPILAKGEMGVEIDTRKFKIGDGIKNWANLEYCNADVKEVEKAQKLSNARNIAATGDATGNTSFDGSEDVSIALTLANSGVTAGTYTKVTVNSKGLVTGNAALVAADIPDLTLSKITDAGTAAEKDYGKAAGNIPILDATGKLDKDVLPDLAITDTHVVASEAAMLALTAQKGDVAVRSDEKKTYILKAEPASNIANWTLLETPTDAVLSVNAKTGAVVLDTDDIKEGSNNLFYTDDRADARIAAAKVEDLSDGSKAVMDGDTGVILDCGNA